MFNIQYVPGSSQYCAPMSLSPFTDEKTEV
jgi:hypothetical protein